MAIKTFEEYHYFNKIRHKWSEKNGKFHGDYTIWYAGGQMSNKVSMKDGKRNGADMKWHENGEKRWIRNYVNGKQHGPDIGFYKNGKIKYIRLWKNGFIDGNFKVWDKHGCIIRNEDYIFGRPISKPIVCRIRQILSVILIFLIRLIIS